jgi:hypothetical protein
MRKQIGPLLLSRCKPCESDTYGKFPAKFSITWTDKRGVVVWSLDFIPKHVLCWWRTNDIRPSVGKYHRCEWGCKIWVFSMFTFYRFYEEIAVEA